MERIPQEFDKTCAVVYGAKQRVDAGYFLPSPVHSDEIVRKRPSI